MTGGKAFYNTNDLAASFKRAADDASSYYLVGYYLDTQHHNAGWRQLKVKVDKKDTEVRARKGFFVTNATLHSDLTKTPTCLRPDLADRGHRCSVTVQWAGVAGDGDKKKAVYHGAHAAEQPDLRFRRSQNKLNFDFAAVAFDDKNGKEVTAPV